LALLFSVFRNYNKLKSQAKFTIANVKSKDSYKPRRSNFNYEIKIANKFYSGSKTVYFSDELYNSINYNGGAYLAIYAVSDPAVNIIFFDKPLNESINLDSLSALKVNNEIWSFWDL
jgi:hypothetical protein